jgi:hypothetical protein
VEDAVDPTLINWENLGIGERAQGRAKCAVNFTAFVLLLVTFFAVAILTRMKANFK